VSTNPFSSGDSHSLCGRVPVNEHRVTCFSTIRESLCRAQADALQPVVALHAFHFS
jgi:hypothetical protein